ncbi:MAG TPA: Spy/CpxP family protein refolding chaperone [Steroidobacteraceae bacterium]|jgi:Spy/CpxP family protein refolding chaperone|nr:Spy/CpxP family protein refolding chaperone [Steroidobacteraceae bacterium]
MSTPSRAMNLNRTRAIVVATLAAAALAGLAVHAADSADATPQASGAHHWHHHGPGARFMHVLKQLNLTPEQQTQIKGIFASAKSQFRELGASMRSNREALAAAAPTDAGYPALLAAEKANAAKRIDQMSAVKTQIYAVLTPAQIKQIPQILAADKAKWQQRHENSAPAASASTPSTSS